jgi:riboflavin kinase, archaea type
VPRPRNPPPTPPAPPRLKAEELAVLRQLALAGADRSPVVLTSREIGERIHVSQQGADRYLVELEKRGLISRALAARRQRLTVTPEGMNVLRSEHHTYRRIFEGPSRVAFAGAVASGMGEGRYYLSQPGYVVQFSERLGYEPYLGTFNVRLESEAVRTAAMLQHWSGIRIDGFQAGGRTFGGATCFVARLNGRTCHLIRPDRTHYADVVEFIAKEYLRGALKVSDGDPVAVEVDEA